MDANHIIDHINDLLGELDQMLPGPVSDKTRSTLLNAYPVEDVNFAAMHVLQAQASIETALSHFNKAVDLLSLPPLDEGDDEIDEWDLEESEGE